MFRQLLLIACLGVGGVAWTANEPPNCVWPLTRLAFSQYLAAANQIRTDRRIIDVGMYESQRTQYPNACKTEGAGPCLAIAVINLRTKTAYVGHFVSLDEDNFEAEVRKIIGDARAEAAGPGDLQIVLAGMTRLLSDKIPRKLRSASETFQWNAQRRVDKVLAESQVPPAQILDHRSLKQENASYNLLVDPVTKQILLQRDAWP